MELLTSRILFWSWLKITFNFDLFLSYLNCKALAYSLQTCQFHRFFLNYHHANNSFYLKLQFLCFFSFLLCRQYSCILYAAVVFLTGKDFSIVWMMFCTVLIEAYIGLHIYVSRKSCRSKLAGKSLDNIYRRNLS